MAKKDKAEKVEKEAPAKTEFKFGVSDLAEKLGLNEASVRVKLRNAGVKKAGKSYGWNSKAELQEVIDELKGDGDDKPAKKAKKAAKDDADEKPAKKAKKAKAEADDSDDDEDEKPAKKSKKKKSKKSDEDDD